MSFFKNMVMRKMIESKMKDVPPEQKEQLISMIEKNPEFFQKIAEEIQNEVKSGKDQMAATMEVLQKYQSELRDLM